MMPKGERPHPRRKPLSPGTIHYFPPPWCANDYQSPPLDDELKKLLLNTRLNIERLFEEVERVLRRAEEYRRMHILGEQAERFLPG
jgi:hypothetical protein